MGALHDALMRLIAKKKQENLAVPPAMTLEASRPVVIDARGDYDRPSVLGGTVVRELPRDTAARPGVVTPPAEALQSQEDYESWFASTHPDSLKAPASSSRLSGSEMTNIFNPTPVGELTDEAIDRAHPLRSLFEAGVTSSGQGIIDTAKGLWRHGKNAIAGGSDEMDITGEAFTKAHPSMAARSNVVPNLVSAGLNVLAAPARGAMAAGQGFAEGGGYSDILGGLARIPEAVAEEGVAMWEGKEGAASRGAKTVINELGVLPGTTFKQNARAVVDYWAPKMMDGYESMPDKEKDQFADMVGEAVYTIAVDPTTWIGGFEMGVAKWGNKLKGLHAGLQAAEAAGDVAKVAKIQKDMLAANRVIDRLDKIAAAPKKMVDAALKVAGKAASENLPKLARLAGRAFSDVGGGMEAGDALTGGIGGLMKGEKAPKIDFGPIDTELAPGIKEMPDAVRDAVFEWSTSGKPTAESLRKKVLKASRKDPREGALLFDELMRHEEVGKRLGTSGADPVTPPAAGVAQASPTPPVKGATDITPAEVPPEVDLQQVGAGAAKKKRIKLSPAQKLAEQLSEFAPPAISSVSDEAAEAALKEAEAALAAEDAAKLGAKPRKAKKSAAQRMAEADDDEGRVRRFEFSEQRNIDRVLGDLPEQVIERDAAAASRDWIPTGPGSVPATSSPDDVAQLAKSRGSLREKIKKSAARRLADAAGEAEGVPGFLRSAEDKAGEMVGDFREPASADEFGKYPRSAEDIVAQRGAVRDAEQARLDDIAAAEKRAADADKLSQEGIAADEEALLKEQYERLKEEDARAGFDKYSRSSAAPNSPAQKLSGVIGRQGYTEAFEMLKESDPGFTKFLDDVGQSDPEAMTALEKIEAVAAYRRSPVTRQQAMAETMLPRNIDESLRWLDEYNPPAQGPASMVREGPIDLPPVGVGAERDARRIDVDYEDLLPSEPPAQPRVDYPIEEMPGRFATDDADMGRVFDADTAPPGLGDAEAAGFDPTKAEFELDELRSVIGGDPRVTDDVMLRKIFSGDDVAGDFDTLYARDDRFREFFGNMDEAEIHLMSEADKAQAMKDFAESLVPKVKPVKQTGWRPSGQSPTVPPKGGQAANAPGATSPPPGATASQSGPPSIPPGPGGGGGGRGPGGPGGGGGGRGPGGPGGGGAAGGPGPAGGFVPPPGSPTIPSDEIIKSLQVGKPPDSMSLADRFVYHWWNRARSLSKRKLDKAVKAFDALPAFNDALGQAFDRGVMPAFAPFAGHEQDVKTYLVAGSFKDRAAQALVKASRTRNGAERAMLLDVGNWWTNEATNAQNIIVKRLNAKTPGLGDKLADAQAALNKFVREEGLNRLVDVGGIDRGVVDQMQKANPNYMRFEVLERSDGAGALLDHTDIETLQKYRKTGLGQALKDEQLHLIDPLDETFNKVTDIRRAAEKIHVQNELLDNYAAQEGWKRIMTKDEADKLGLKPGEYWAKGGPRPSATDFTEMTRRVADAGSESGWRAETWLVPKDIALTMDNISPQKFGFFRNVLNQFFKQAVTTLNPAFIVRNVQRDWHAAFANAAGIYKPQDIFAYALRDYPTSMAKAIAHTYFPNSKWAKEVEEALRAGMGFGFSGTLRESGKATRALFPKLRTRMWNHWTNPIEQLKRLAETVELAPRMAVYSKAKSLGLTNLDSALAAKAATIDYNAGGVIAKAWNEIVPFLNARIQGKRSMFNAIKKDPTGTLMKMAITHGTLALTAYAVNQIYFSDLVAEVPQHIKDRYHYLVTGSDKTDPKTGKPIPTVWLSPRDEGGTFTGLFENGMEHLKNNNPEAWFRLVVQTLHDFASPVDFASDGQLDLAATAANLIGPQLTGIIEASTGTRVDGRPVVPYDVRSQSEGAKYREYDENTPELYKWMADNPLNPKGRRWNVSPMSIQRVLEGFIGPIATSGGNPLVYLDKAKKALRREVGGGTDETIIDSATKAAGEKERAEYEIGAAIEKGDMAEAVRLRDEWHAMIPGLEAEFQASGAAPYQIEAWKKAALITDRQMPGLVAKEKVAYVDRKMGVKRDDVPARVVDAEPVVWKKGKRKPGDMKRELMRRIMMERDR